MFPVFTASWSFCCSCGARTSLLLAQLLPEPLCGTVTARHPQTGICPLRGCGASAGTGAFLAKGAPASLNLNGSKPAITHSNGSSAVHAHAVGGALPFAAAMHRGSDASLRDGGASFGTGEGVQQPSILCTACFATPCCTAAHVSALVHVQIEACHCCRLPPRYFFDCRLISVVSSAAAPLACQSSG